MYKNKEKNFVSVVLYAHNVEHIIENVLDRIHTEFSQTFEAFEIICVDDCSSDQTSKIVKDKSGHFDGCSLTLMHLSYYSGIEQAMTAGVDLAIGDFVVEVDDITIPDFHIFTELYYKAISGYDIVAARDERSGTFGSKLYYYLFNQYTFSQEKISSEFGRIISRRALNRAKSMSKVVLYRKFTYANSGLKYTTIPYHIQGHKKPDMSFEKRKELAVNTLVMFTDIAYKFSMVMICTMLAITIATLMYTVILYFETTPVAGWTTTMLLLSIGLSGVFVLFAVVIKYLSIILDLVFKENRVVVDYIEKITK